jgi:hypothetical protein
VPYQGLDDGSISPFNGRPPRGSIIEAFSILEIDAPSFDALGPVIFHQRRPSSTANWLRDTGDWLVLHKIEDESAALERLGIALTDEAYAVLTQLGTFRVIRRVWPLGKQAASGRVWVSRPCGGGHCHIP